MPHETCTDTDREARNSAILRDYEAGRRIATISRTSGLSRNRVYQIIRNNGAVRRAPLDPPERISPNAARDQFIVDAYRAGVPARTLQENHGIGKARFYQILRAAVSLRPD